MGEAEIAKHVLPEGLSEPAGPHQPITVAQLLERAVREGQALRLNWRNEDDQRATADPEGMGPGEFPTGVFPVVGNDNDEEED